MFKLAFLVFFACMPQEVALDSQVTDNFNIMEKNKFLNCFGDKRVLGDLLLTEDQEAKVSELYKKKNRLSIEAARNEVYSPAEMTKRINEIQESVFQSFYFDTLLPHQRERAFQLVARRDLQSVGGSLAVFISKKLDAELKLTVSQKRQMVEIHNKKKEELARVAKQFKEAVAEILAQEKKEVEALLTTDQTVTLQKKFGDEYLGPGLNGSTSTVLTNYLKREK